MTDPREAARDVYHTDNTGERFERALDAYDKARAEAVPEGVQVQLAWLRNEKNTGGWFYERANKIADLIVALAAQVAEAERDGVMIESLVNQVGELTEERDSAIELRDHYQGEAKIFENHMKAAIAERDALRELGTMFASICRGSEWDRPGCTTGDTLAKWDALEATEPEGE